MGSAVNEVAQTPRLGPGPYLQLLIAEAGLGALLGRDHIRFLHLEACGEGQGEELSNLQRNFRVVNPGRQRRIVCGMGKKGIKLLVAHGDRRRKGRRRRWEK